MAGLLLVTLPSLLLEDNDLVAANMAQYLGRHACTFYEGSADLDLAAVFYQYYVAEFNRFTGFRLQPVNVYFLVLLDLKLLACNIYNLSLIHI